MPANSTRILNYQPATDTWAISVTTEPRGDAPVTDTFNCEFADQSTALRSVRIEMTQWAKAIDVTLE